MQTINERRDTLNYELSKILEFRNILKSNIDQKSIYEIEEEMNIGHYKTSITEGERRGYIVLSTSSKDRLKDDLKILLE